MSDSFTVENVQDAIRVLECWNYKEPFFTDTTKRCALCDRHMPFGYGDFCTKRCEEHYAFACEEAAWSALAEYLGAAGLLMEEKW